MLPKVFHKKVHHHVVVMGLGGNNVTGSIKTVKTFLDLKVFFFVTEAILYSITAVSDQGS